MIRKTAFILSSLILLFCVAANSPDLPSNFYDLSIKTLDGNNTINFKDYKGKMILCVNTASECGFTHQYEGLEKLYETHKDKLVIVGFPCNQFGEQEPGTAADIGTFCKERYHVTFPMAEKIDVKGENQHPVYQWLTQKKYNKKEDLSVRWNFGKFLLDEKGKFVAYFPSQVDPMDEKIVSLIEGKK